MSVSTIVSSGEYWEQCPVWESVNKWPQHQQHTNNVKQQPDTIDHNTVEASADDDWCKITHLPKYASEVMTLTFRVCFKILMHLI